jgi:hypothetical protein
MKASLRLIFVLAAIILIPVEHFCVASSLETQGEVLQALFQVLIWGNVLWIAMCWWLPRSALAGLLCLAFLIIPYQVVLLDRLVRIEKEVMRIVDSRVQMRVNGKPIPDSLDDYKFADPSIREFIYSYSASEDGTNFGISYFVVQPGITHSYNSKDGWNYYPD